MNKITVVDSIMGSGKTSWAKQYMNGHKTDKRFIYVTPYLDEIAHNVKKEVTHLIEPNAVKGSKMKHFKQLLAEGQDIVTTHALFGLFDAEVHELLNGAGYTLILDEVFNVIEQLYITQSDVKNLIATGTMIIEDHKVIWLDDEYDGAFNNLKNHANNGNAYSHNGAIVFWTFPAKMFTVFEEVFVLTYLFNGQIQRYYYDFHNVQYDYKAVDKVGDEFILTEYNTANENRAKYADLINIYDGELNCNYLPNGKTLKHENELSTTWFKNVGEDTLERLQKNIYTYFRNVVKAKAKDLIWTCLKDQKNTLKGKGYTKGHIPLNARATNDYKDTHNLAYVFNRFMNPNESNFFASAGIKIDQDLLAVSDLLQWIWRSAVRNNPAEPINVYIPSKRMRTLLQAWLNGEI